MSKHDQPYDILDIIRVIRGSWILLLFIPSVVAGTVGFWAFQNISDVEYTRRVQAVISVPELSIEAGTISRAVHSAAAASEIDNRAFVTLLEEIPAGIETPNRTVRIIVESRADVDSLKLLNATIQIIETAVDEFDRDIERQLSDIDARRMILTGYLAAFAEQTSASRPTTAAADATAISALINASSILEEDARSLAELGRGPLELVTMAEEPEEISSSRWLRFPIVAWIGGLLAVLFVAFTLDGIRLTRARRT
ncbi:MAG: hypothetical protein P0Y65_16605 [Candidatus Devosia phytovorans]|uniref:Uncharacterized protein n=1 Tax=Candidatus Devosia phytovorans TaxID=3121372 RepID=A0AAJ5VTS7_9HYPH|nr:hypothetical protein [Devosia sp.]WEK03795.1 MAG: hypothetical protein P0Y65_16605 [Devosia sp.]